MATDVTRSSEPTEQEREAVANSVDELGVLKTAANVGVSRETIVRIIAGLPVHRGSVALLRQHLRGEGEK
jgi:hypothetical protein